MRMPRTCDVDGCNNLASRRGWCERHYRRWLRLGNPCATKYRTVEDRFWAKVAKTDSCWNWRASCNNKGYGQFYPSRKPLLAHRFAYELCVGSIADGLQVLHHCDNPPCCNPEHLFLGTSVDNMRDMVSKARHNPVRGSASPRAKLTEEDVLNILQRYADGAISQAGLSREYGVHPSIIYGIVHGERWPHVYVMWSCRESSWDCAISKADWKQSESRRRARLQDAVIRQTVATPTSRMEFVTAVRAESDRMLAEGGWDVETPF